MERHDDGERPPTLYADPLEGVRLAPLNGADDVRFVYFIGVGDRPHAHLVVSRLLYALYSPTHLFLIHVDIKAAEAAAEACFALQLKHANVRVLRARRLVQWGMFSMVAIGLDAMHTVLEAGLAFDYFINLSDADLALRTDAEMRAFFGRPGIRGRSLINVHEGGGPALLDATAFINRHTIVECGGYGFVAVNQTPANFPLTHGCCIGRSGPVAFAELPLQRHDLLESLSAHTGSQWVALAYTFCRDLLTSAEGRRWLSAFERRLVPDESIFQTAVMHSPRHKHALINHNLRWIDWPHAHGDPNEYWNRLGSHRYIGGPRVLNSSELRAVLSSPYLFARKVDLTVDADVLRQWDVWMAAKLAGEPPEFPQAPIGHSPGDPDLTQRFRAPGLGRRADGSRRVRRRLATITFDDGSHCGCGDACQAVEGACCDPSLCEPPPTPDDPSPGRGSPREALPACPDAPRHRRSTPGGAPAKVHWFNGARHPVQLSVVGYEGEEVHMYTLEQPDASASLNTQEHVVWRARALSGELLLEYVAADLARGQGLATTAGQIGEAVVTVRDCQFRHTGAAAVVAASVSTGALVGIVDRTVRM